MTGFKVWQGQMEVGPDKGTVNKGAGPAAVKGKR